MPYWRAILALFSILMLQSCRHDSVARGDRFYKNGRYSDAEVEFQRALQKAPRSGEAYLRLGRTEERLGNYPAALHALRQAADLMPGDDTPKIDLANFMLVAYLGNPGRTPELYREIAKIAGDLLAKNAHSFDGARLKGYLAMADRKPAEAVEYFETATRVRGNEPDVITALAESLALDGNKQEAEEVALAFLRDKPDYGPLYTFLYQLYMRAGRLADAETILKSKVDHNPGEGLYRIELARHYARAGRTQEMSDALSRLLDNPKDFRRAHLDVGDFYVESRNWPAAIHQYEQGLESDPQGKAVYLKRLLRTDLAANDRPAAQRDLERILKDDPRDREARASRAALRMAGDDPEQKRLAVTEFKALVDEAPENVNYRTQYADALRATGDREATREQYRLIVQRQPGNLAALQSLADLSIQGEHIDDALTYAGRVLAIDPRNADAALVRSAALATRGQFNETRAILAGLVRDHPGLREAQLQLALLDAEQGHYADAERRFRRYYVPGKGDVRSLEGMVEMYRAQNQMDRALTMLKEDLREGPQSNGVRVLYASTARQAGQIDLAIDQYEQLVQAEPESPVMAVQLGLAYQGKGDLARATQELERAARLVPDSAIAQAYLGKVYDEAGRGADALRSYRRSLALDNRNPWVMNNIAYLLAETGGDLNESLTMARDALQKDPNNRSFLDTLGRVYFRKREFASAIHIFEALRDKSPKEVVFRIHLGEALLGAGDRNQCRSELQAAGTLLCTPRERDRIDRLLKEAERAT